MRRKKGFPVREGTITVAEVGVWRLLGELCEVTTKVGPPVAGRVTLALREVYCTHTTAFTQYDLN